MKKKSEIKPNLPDLEEIQELLRKRDKRTMFSGRPRKWQDGEQVRLSTRVKPNTLIYLKGVSKDTGTSIGDIIDKMVMEPKG
jgi:ABC-type Zn uptake system ZnuABC Zn-binding protein ZnuA